MDADEEKQKRSSLSHPCASVFICVAFSSFLNRSRERHLGRLALRGIGDVEVLAPPEAEHRRDEVRRERLPLLLVPPHAVVEVLATEPDLVLRARQLLLELPEVRVRLELRIRLGERKQPP